MKVAIFIPCYVDHLYPQVGMSVVRLFENLGLDFSVPFDQSCCGQPLLYSGHEGQAKKQIERHHRQFEEFDYVVTPSGSCASTLRENPTPHASIKTKTMELCEFLHDVIALPSFAETHSEKIAIHRSCRGIRCLKLGGATELAGKTECKVSNLLRAKPGIELVETTSRRDECCGFGGSYSVMEPNISAAMGIDRLELFLNAGAETITATDMGCLAHLQGLIEKRGYPLRTKHIAEILAGESA